MNIWTWLKLLVSTTKKKETTSTVVYDHPGRLKQFKDISIGQVFLSEGKTYMKTSEDSAIPVEMQYPGGSDKKITH